MIDTRLGDTLREQRLSLGITIDQAAEQTHIRARVLKTFENTDFNNFPPDGYVRSMLSTYARFLSLDPHQIIAAYDFQVRQFRNMKTEGRNLSKVRATSRFGDDELIPQVADRTAEDPISAPRDTSSIKVIRRTNDSRARSSRGGAEPLKPDKTGSFVVTRESMELGATERKGPLPTEGTGEFKATSAISSVQPRSARRRKTSSADRDRRSATSARADYSHPSSVSRNSENSRDSVRRLSRLDTGENNSTEYQGLAPHETGRLSYTDSLRNSGSSTPPYSTGRLSSMNIESEASEDHAPTDYSLRERSASNKPTSRNSHNSSRQRERYHAAPNEGLISRAVNGLIAIFKDSRTRLIALAVICLIAAVAIAVSILVSSAGSDSSDILEVEGGASGQSNSETVTDENGNTTTTVTTVNGNPVIIKVEVPEGKTSLINVTYDSDIAYNGTAVGPWSREFNVTSSFVGTFGTPDSVTVTENGTAVEIPKNADGTGTLTINIKAAGLAANATS